MKLKRKVQSTGNPVLDKWRELPVPASTQVLTNLRGSFKADILMLGEHPTGAELQSNAPFADDHAQLFFEMLEEATGMRDDRFLIVPHSRYGPKPCKASCEGVLPYLQWLVSFKKFKCVACVGMNAFGYTFASGRKTHAATIIGNPMWLPFLNNLPVFVFPDTSRMYPVNPDNFRDVRFAEESRQANLQICEKFGKWYATI